MLRLWNNFWTYICVQCQTFIISYFFFCYLEWKILVYEHVLLYRANRWLKSLQFFHMISCRPDYGTSTCSKATLIVDRQFATTDLGSRDDSGMAEKTQWWERSPSTNVRSRVWFHGPSATRGLSLLLVLVLAPRVFLRILRFSTLHKNQHC